MTLVFTRESAPRVGSTALVAVKCLGSQTGLCSGTVTVTLNARKHKVPFSLSGGSQQSLAVPIGTAKDGADTTGVAVARTVQPEGGYARDSAVLEIH